MLIAVLMTGLTLALAPIAISEGHKKDDKKYYFICSVLWVLSSIRNPFVGTDSVNNYNAFLNIKDGYFLDYGSGYILFVKVIQLLSDNYRFFLIVVATIILMPIFFVFSRLRYRSFAVILFSMTGFISSFDVIKGYLALSFAIVAAYYWGEKKKWVSCVWAVIAVFFHPSITLILGLMFVATQNIKKTGWIIIYTFGAALLMPGIRSSLSNLVINLAGLISSRYSRYEINNYYSTTYALTYALGSFVLFLEYGNLMASYPNKRMLRFFINMHLLGQWLALFGGFIPAVNRYMKFVLVFSIILICECIKYCRIMRNRWVLGCETYSVFMVFLFLNNGGIIYTVGG